MRIIYIHQYFNTLQMAGGTRSFEMARRLVEQGHDVHMITAWREPTDTNEWYITEESGITVHWCPIVYSNRMGFNERIFSFFKFAISALRYASKIDGDVVFATSTPLTIALPGIYVSKRKKIPMVFEVRDLWPEVPIALGVIKNPFLKFFLNKLELAAYRNSKRVVALAPGMKESVVAKSGVPEAIVDVIPNGADLSLFSSNESEESSLRSKHSIPDDRQIVLYAGALGRVNGVDYIARLSAEIKKLQNENNYLFVIIGDGVELEKIKNIAEKLNVLNDMVMLVGSKSKQEVIDWYRMCTVSIMTYSGPEIVYRDSVSNKFFDSLAAGKPILSNFSGFSTKIAEEFDAGKILPSNPAEAAPLFLKCMNNDNWVRDAGIAARKLAEERFSRDKLAHDLEQSLLTAVGKEKN